MKVKQVHFNNYVYCDQYIHLKVGFFAACCDDHSRPTRVLPQISNVFFRNKNQMKVKQVHFNNYVYCDQYIHLKVGFFAACYDDHSPCG